MFHETESHAVFLLQEQGVTRFDVINFISHGVSKTGADDDREVHGANEESEHEGDGEPDGEEGTPKLSPSKALKTYAVNLAERAAAGKIDPLIGRRNEVERAIHVLLRRRKNNPVFVGEAGVGKTALAEGLALGDSRRQSARRAQRRAYLCARYGRAARRHPLSRRLRTAP